MSWDIDREEFDEAVEKGDFEFIWSAYEFLREERDAANKAADEEHDLRGIAEEEVEALRSDTLERLEHENERFRERIDELNDDVVLCQRGRVANNKLLRDKLRKAEAELLEAREACRDMERRMMDSEGIAEDCLRRAREAESECARLREVERVSERRQIALRAEVETLRGLLAGTMEILDKIADWAPEWRARWTMIRTEARAALAKGGEE